MKVCTLIASIIVVAWTNGNAISKLRPKARISGGTSAHSNQFPFMALIVIDDSLEKWGLCAGSIISDSFILTAAYCTSHFRDIAVYLGSISFKKGKLFDIEKHQIINHEHFNPETMENDISLIRIPELKFSCQIRAIRLPLITLKYTPYFYVGERFYAAGWGCTSDYTKTVCSTKLKYVQQTVVSNEVCSQHFSNIVDSNMCISTIDRKSPCLGDAGGPLIEETSSIHGPIQVGIMSVGSAQGCEKGLPVVYTRLSSYLNWIKAKSGIAHY